jgi:hypothetical protein
MRTNLRWARAALHRTFHFDTGLAHLRDTAVTMTGVLGTWAAALLVERWAGLRVDAVIQAVVIASSLGRAQRVLDRADRLIACAVLPAAAAGATGLGTLIARHPDAGDTLFTLAAAGSVWVRRYGPRFARAGAVLTPPLIAVLVAGGQPPGAPGGAARAAWSALLALIAVCWGALVLGAARRAGVVGRRPSRRVAASATRRPGVRPSTRLALQLATALGAAFAVGRALWPTHWTWVVLTAFIVCSGARGRGDVLLKGARRSAGAAVGTVLAGPLSGAFGPHSDAAVAAMFTVLAVATWLRELNYAYWAGCVTALLSLLYDWFGEPPGNLLHTRLTAIALGATLAATTSSLVLPLPTRLTPTTARPTPLTPAPSGARGTVRPARHPPAHGHEPQGATPDPRRSPPGASRLSAQFPAPLTPAPQGREERRGQPATHPHTATNRKEQPLPPGGHHQEHRG